MSRYDRLLELSTFSKEKLALLSKKRILLVGVGGVGQYVATSLITNGIKYLTIVDFDKVELSNLNRQILLTEKDEGKSKSEVVLKALQERNSEADLIAINMKVDQNNVDALLNDIDVVVDAVDNWESKLVLGQACAKRAVPFLHIGVDGNRGQYCLFEKKSIFDVFDSSIKEEPRDGVMGPMVGLIASMATLHLLNYLVKDESCDVLYYFDNKTKQFGHTKI